MPVFMPGSADFFGIPSGRQKPIGHSPIDPDQSGGGARSMRAYQKAPLSAKCYAIGDVGGTLIDTLANATAYVFRFEDASGKEVPVGAFSIQNENANDVLVCFDSEIDLLGTNAATDLCHVRVKGGETRPFAVYLRKMVMYNISGGNVEYGNTVATFDKELWVIGWPAE